jgi:hypothetical protein
MPIAESEPKTEAKPKRKSEEDVLLDGAAKYAFEYGKCRHIFLDSLSEPGYCRCKACGRRATEQFVAVIREQFEDAEKEKAAAFVREHNK